MDAALHCFDEAGRLGWPEEDLRLQRSLALLQAGHHELADALLQEIASGSGDDDLAEEFYEAQALGLMQSYRFNEALVCLDFWSKWRPEAVPPRLLRADIRERILHWSDAAAEFRAVLKVAPAHAGARRGLARCLMELNDPAGALREYERCLQAGSEDHEAVLGAAKCLRRLGQLAEAEEQLRALLKRDVAPVQRAGLLVELGHVALVRQAPAEAVRWLREAVSVEPRDPEAQHVLGIAYARTGDTDRAAAHREEAERLQAQYGRLAEITIELLAAPENPSLRWEAGRILMDQGLKREGAAWMATALRDDPGYRPAHDSLARYYAEIGDERRAARHAALARAQESLPTSQEAQSPSCGEDE